MVIVFFNKDHVSMTFIRFYATSNGDLIDPANRRLIHKRMIPKDLMTGFKIQNVPISDENDQ